MADTGTNPNPPQDPHPARPDAPRGDVGDGEAAVSEALREVSILTPTQERALLGLLADPIIARAARAVGLDESTIRRYLHDPVFAECYRISRQSIFGQAIAMAQKYSSIAVQTLAKIASDDDQQAAARVAACALLLRTSREDNPDNMRRLEEHLAGMKSAAEWTDEELLLTLQENLPEVVRRHATRPAPAIAAPPGPQEETARRRAVS